MEEMTVFSGDSEPRRFTGVRATTPFMAMEPPTLPMGPTASMAVPAMIAF
jgi:hypothetical protein